MRLMPGSVDVLSRAEIGAVHRAALRILAEVGLCVENEEMLRHLEAHGARVDYAVQRARFAPALTERFLAETEKLDWATLRPGVSGSAGVYHSLYHDPDTRELAPWDEERLACYFGLARELPHVGSAHMLGCRLPCPPRLQPLYERYYCWKYGAREDGTLHLDALCPYIYDLYQMRAQALGKRIEEVFKAAAYLVPALKIGRHEAYQFIYFWKRGLRVGLGDMHAMGATAPVTMAGSLALSLAEHLALGILQRAFFGGNAFTLGCSIAPFDMRTMIYPFGRPETAFTGVAMVQIARFYGIPFRGHAGLTNAKLPSCEVGAQKALSALPILLASGHFHMDAGLLAVDEVCSPVQMILDNEFLSALQHLCAEYDVSDEALAVEVIAEMGPGGHYVGADHTARHFRRELWEPKVWSREMLAGWMERGRPLDADYAAEIYRDMRPSLTTPSLLSPDE